MLDRFTRRDFLCLSTLAAAAPIFEVKFPRGLALPIASDTRFTEGIASVMVHL